MENRWDEEEEKCRWAAEIAEQQKWKQAEADQLKLDTFLMKHRYRSVNDKKVSVKKDMVYTMRPLHTAIELKDDDMVRVLLDWKADPLLESSNVLPLQRADELNEDGSHHFILQMLSAAAGVPMPVDQGKKFENTDIYCATEENLGDVSCTTASFSNMQPSALQRSRTAMICSL